MSISRIDEGLIVKMDYYGKTTNVFKSAYYLIINSTYNGYGHVFDIDFVPAAVLKLIIQLTKNKVIENYLFGNSTYSYYNFPSTNKSLYTKLLPIFGRAYRKLIKSPKHIRRTYIVDYNFGKVRGPFNPKFVIPSIEEEKPAFSVVAKRLKIKYKKMLEFSKFGKLKTLTPTMWSSLQYTDSWDVSMNETNVIDIATKNGNPVDTAKRILKGMKSNQTFYAPIIMYHDGSYYCISGNIRLSAAMALKIVPKVYIFTYNENT
jgi:hypothetical protein